MLGGEQEPGDGRTSNSAPAPCSRPSPNSLPGAPATPGSVLSLSVRVWKILAPLTFSMDVRRDSLDPTTVVDFCESVDIRDDFPPAPAAVDSPLNGDDVDPRDTLSPLRENDLLRRGRAALDRASMCSNTDKQARETRRHSAAARSRRLARPAPDRAQCGRLARVRTFQGLEHAVDRVVLPERDVQILHRREGAAAVPRRDATHV